MAMVIYGGIDSRGKGQAGLIEVQTMAAIAAFVEAHFATGWRDLTVQLRVKGGRYREVGWIVTGPDGRRTWWAEK